MPDIDFLPERYRSQTVERRVQTWRIGVGLLFGGIIVVVALAQQAYRRSVSLQLAALEAPYAQAETQTAAVRQQQLRHRAKGQEANLLAYLRHPWPKSQILAAIAEVLPEAVTLSEVAIVPQEPPKTASAVPAAPAKRAKRASKEPDELAKLPAAVRDLTLLRKECDQRMVVVDIFGHASDEVALHRYLGALGEIELFERVELASIETNTRTKQAGVQFHARLFVKPGIGQLRPMQTTMRKPFFDFLALAEKFETR